LLQRTANELLVRPLPWKGSADLFTLAAAQGLMVRQKTSRRCPKVLKSK